MIDPPREEAKNAVKECITAGIVPVMITGDHPVTARAIAAEIGIITNEDDRLITGKELAAMSEEQFARIVDHIKVYARVNPEQKLKIVKTLQKKNHFVSMTGDGVNDAPALKQANIGVAMGITGTDVSKEASHMILLDDNFATIIKAVREGRRIFDNIRKFIRYIMTGNSSEIWTLLLAPLIGLPIPLLPIHILWINLVTDGLPALALANEPAEENIMQRPPRTTTESIFSQGLGLHVLWVGLLMGALCLGVQAWAVHAENEKWQTMVFTTLCFCQMAHVLAIKSENSFFYRSGFLTNIFLSGSVLLTFLLQLALIYLPLMNEVFSTKPLSLNELLVCIGAGLIVFHAVELEKWIRKLKTTNKTV
jgi:Ca2+-transporting ATPase